MRSGESFALLFSQLLASSTTELQTGNRTAMHRSGTSWRVSPTLETVSNITEHVHMAKPDPISVLKSLSYSHVREAGTCLERLGPINASTPSCMVDMIVKHKKEAENSSQILSYLISYLPSVNDDDLIVSFKGFLKQNMISLRSKLPYSFAKAFKSFIEGYIKQRLVLKSLSNGAVLDFRRVDEQNLSFAIAITNRYMTWPEFYVLSAEYLT